MPDRSFLTWPFFEPRHRDLAARLEAWCREELADPRHPEDDAALDVECRRLLSRLAKGGWLAYATPAAYGGVHDVMDVRSLCLIRETLARYSGLADFVFAMQGLGSGVISLFGDEAQKERYLPAVAHGEKIAAFALTELASGSDVAAMDTAAVQDGDGYVLTGAKTYISNGGLADFYVVFARTGEGPGAKGISAFVVDADTPGFEVRERIRVIAPHPLATIAFNNMRVPRAALVGDPGRGFGQAMSTLDVFRPTVGAAALGFARRALDEATQRALTRRLFGAPLSDHPVTQTKLAEMAVAIDASALLVYRAAWARDIAGQNTREAAIAKLFATEAAQSVIDKAVQIFGGLGVVHGVPVEGLYREVRALRIYEGASEVQNLIIARRHLADATAA